MDPVDNPQLKLAFDFVQYTGTHIFLTGKAGTGKTTFLRNLKENSPKRMVVVAPTGVAAINAGGVTIHSFFQMPFGPYIPNDGAEGDMGNNSRQSFQRMNRDKINIMKSLDLLVIDEISMVRADLLDGIDEVLRRYRNRYMPFGGVQLLMIGDLQQLAPVVKDDEWSILRKYYDNAFFFSSLALKKTQYITIELKHIYRQSDPVFIGLLNKIRDNQPDAVTLHELNKRHIPGFSLTAGEGYITLTTHNYQAQELNENKLRQIAGKEYKFKAVVEGEFPEYSYPTDLELCLKVGAQVMFVKNDSSREKLFYNGKIGKIESIEEGTIFVRCPDEEDVIAVNQTEWQNNRYTIDEETKEIKESVVGKFVHYPLKLAWAITIHKSQGLTFERAIIDAKAAFAHGQVYVALSRCKTLEGLVLSSPLSESAVKADSTVTQFTRNAGENPPGEEFLSQSKLNYQISLILQLFDFKTLQWRLSYCLKLMDEHRPSLHLSFIDVFDTMNTKLKSELTEVSDKFRIQVQQYITQNNQVEENVALQDRVKKACPYFEEKIEGSIYNILKNISIDIDNKVVRKSITDAVNRLREEAGVKLSGFKACKDGFYVKNFLSARAKASIDLTETTKAVAKKQDLQVPAIVPHPKLYNELKAWRQSKADKSSQPIYMILPQKTLIDVVVLLPATLKQLNNIKGFGTKKIHQFGDEILAIIQKYREEYSEEVSSAVIKEQAVDLHDAGELKSEKAPKINTKKVTYDLFKQGKTIVEIADERAIAPTTVEGHLAHYVSTGELEVSQFVTADKIKVISDYFSKNENTLLGPAKAALGEYVSWGELRMVFGYLEFKGIVKRQLAIKAKDEE